ncbi:E3 ubiquitin-protein ligase MARCHF5-like isoform X2 [Watersipora subatra]|uniref:E3 ubiquitin-protein ligase MARCHF5-like isoform X2 n=1 Tax=Watersipora subatra TaxID=2589382 RepID=UPI00355B1EC8
MSEAALDRQQSIPALRTCWVCFGTDEDVQLDWLTPCKCKGTAKWVHIRCLQRWIDEKHKHNPASEVHCPQCNHLYKIVYPRMGMTALDLLEKYIHKLCPYVAAGILMGSLYWTSVTYGAVTVMQVLGHKEGVGVMEQADPIFLFIGLPAIPFGLIIGKLLRWEEAVLKVWRKVSSMLPFNSSKESSTSWITGNDAAEDRLPISYTRVLVGALVFPTISTLTGKLCFRSFKSNFQRSLMGGISYFLIKGILRIYYLQMSLKRRTQRQIENYEDEE